MKRIVCLILMCLFLSGCATYKFQHGKPPYDAGYVVTRDGLAVPEYTLGENNSVPDMDVAKRRFDRRRKIVEYYYEEMGLMQSRLQEVVWNPAVGLVKLITGIFRLPFIAADNHKYDHNPEYRKKVQKQREEKQAREDAREQRLKIALASYVSRDLDYERAQGLSPAPATQPETPVKTAAVEKKDIAGSGVESVVTEEKKPELTEEVPAAVESAPVAEPAAPVAAIKEEAPAAVAKPKAAKPAPACPPPRKVNLSRQLKAVIVAKPTSGFSPLKVKFSGSKSYAPRGRIVSYEWDFGDGDTSTKINPTNTYYSGSYQPQYFTVTLTVQDSAGNTAQASTVIEVKNK